jgi:hypothetical protein
VIKEDSVSLDRGAIEKVEDLIRANQPTIEVDGRTYWVDGHGEIKAPTLSNLWGCTLSAFKVFLEKVNLNESIKPFLHIASPSVIGLFDEQETIKTNERHLLMEVKHDTPQFGWAQWQGLEDFMIKCQSCFEMDDNMKLLLKVLGNVTSEEAVTNMDDGISQTVATKAGALASRTELKNPIYLAPMRTFPEVAQVSSPFILRVTGGHNKNVTLFEADAGAWKRKATENIKQWFATELPEIPVVG